MRLPHLVFLLLAGCAGGPADQPGHRLEKTPAAAALAGEPAPDGGIEAANLVIGSFFGLPKNLPMSTYVFQ